MLTFMCISTLVTCYATGLYLCLLCFVTYLFLRWSGILMVIYVSTLLTCYATLLHCIFFPLFYDVIWHIHSANSWHGYAKPPNKSADLMEEKESVRQMVCPKKVVLGNSKPQNLTTEISKPIQRHIATKKTRRQRGAAVQGSCTM